jgi:hypothetical protein
MMPRQALTRVLSGSNFAAGTADNIVFIEWRGRPTKDAVLKIEVSIEGLITEEPGKVGFLVFIPAGNEAPDADARDAFARTMKARASRIVGSALVIDGTGLRSAANRAVLTAITLIGDVNPIPKVCATPAIAAEHLSTLLNGANGSRLLPAEIVASLSQLREVRVQSALG